jgi:hypothetical protein
MWKVTTETKSETAFGGREDRIVEDFYEVKKCVICGKTSERLISRK